MVSHNLRAPVANIAGLTGILKDDQYDEEEKEHALLALTRSVGNLDQVIIDMNNVLQVGSAANQHYEEVSIPLLINEILESIRCLADECNLTINQKLLAGEQMFTIKSYMYSILQNLIVNTIKYRRPEANPVINISSEATDKQITICFEDNAKGIDMYKYGSQVFVPYKRFDQNVDGKGLGLFMVKTQIERLGGTIKIDSDINLGTKFIIKLPVLMPDSRV
jgi:signal transduction histidine kinase